MAIILALDDVKTQLCLEPDFTEHNDMLTKMMAAARKSIERGYYCKLMGSNDELRALPEGVCGFVMDGDIQLAIQYLTGDACLSGFTGRRPETATVRHLLFPLQENTI